TCPCLTSVLLPGVCSHSIAIDVRAVVTPGGPPARRRWPCLGRRSSKRVFGRCTTFNRFAGLGTLHALRTLVFRSRTAWLRRFQGRERDVRDEVSVCLGGAGRRCVEAVLPLATDDVRVDVRAPSRSAVFRSDTANTSAPWKESLQDTTRLYPSPGDCLGS